MEHSGRGFLAGQTALSAACAVPMCLWDSTQNWIDRLVHLWRFRLCCLLLLRVMVRMTNVQSTWVVELWEPWLGLESRFRLHLPSSCGLLWIQRAFSHPCIHGLWCFLLGFSLLVCGLGTGISHGCAHFVLSLERLCGTRVATHCEGCND